MFDSELDLTLVQYSLCITSKERAIGSSLRPFDSRTTTPALACLPFLGLPTHVIPSEALVDLFFYKEAR